MPTQSLKSYSVDWNKVVENRERKRALEEYERIQREKQENKPNAFVRSVATVGDFFGNVVGGLAKGIEGIVDLGAGAVGAVGGLFDKGFQKDVKSFIKRDYATEYISDPLNEWTSASYLNDNEVGRIVESVASGVGQMLPAVAVSLVTAGAHAPAAVAQAASLGTMAASAAGSSTEEAYNDGAGYMEGLGYGLVSGAVEAGTEKLFGGVTKGITGAGWLDDAGKAIGKGGKQAAKALGKEVADTGIKRVAKDMAGEAAEEMISEAVNPLTRAIYKGRVENFLTVDHLKSIGEAGLVGALTSPVYGATVGLATSKLGKAGSRVNYVGKNADINASLEANGNISAMLTDYQDRGILTEEAEKAGYESTLKNYRKIEKTLKSVSDTRRAEMIKEFNLSAAFNADGSLKPDFLPSARFSATEGKLTEGEKNGSSVIAERLDREYYSVRLAGKEHLIENDLAEMSADNGEQVRAFSGTLSEQARRNFTKTKKALTALNKYGGSEVSFVITAPNASFKGALNRRGDIIYIGADQLEGDGWAGTLVHEYTHLEEGTEEYKRLVELLKKDAGTFEKAVASLASDYGISKEDVEQIEKKLEAQDESSEKVETIKYSRMNNLSFSENVDKILEMDADEANRRKSEETYVSVSAKTPSVILDNIEDAQNLEVIIRFDALYLAVRKEGTLKGHYHNFGKDIVKTLPEILSNPDCIVKLDNGRYNLLAAVETEKGKNGIVSVELNAVKDINSHNDKYNLVISAFSAKDGYVENLIRNRAVEVKYEKDDLPQVNPQLYKWLSTVNGKSSTTIIPDSYEKSNTFSEKSEESTENSQAEPLTEEERLVYELYQSELGARMSEYTLGSEEFIDRIVRTDAGLAEKLIGGIKSLIGSFKRAGNPEARAEYKQLKKAEKLFLKAARAAGNTQLVNKILAYDNENEDEALDENGETRYNKKSSYIRISEEEYAVISSRIMADNSRYMAREEELPRYGVAFSANVFYIYENFVPGSFGVLKQIKITEGNREYINSIKAEIGGKNAETTIRSSSELNRVLEVLKSRARHNSGNNAVDSQRGANSYDGRISVGQSNGDTVGDYRKGDSNKRGISYSRKGGSGESYINSPNIKAAEYTEEQFCAFGWTRENGILAKGQFDDFTAKFAKAVTGLEKCPKTKDGEYMIAVSNIYSSVMEGVNNVIVFAKGAIEIPDITRVLEIDEFEETILSDKRREIYEAERRGIQQKTQGIFRRYDSSDFGYQQWLQQRNTIKNDRDNDQLGADGGGGSRAAQGTEGKAREGVNKPLFGVVRVFEDITGKERRVIGDGKGSYMVEETSRRNYLFPSVAEAITAENENLISRYAKSSDHSSSWVKSRLASDPDFLKKKVRYSRKGGSGESYISKLISEHENLRVYEREDADKLISEILSNISSEEDSITINATSRKQVTTTLANAFNKARSELERKKAAESIAEYLINRSAVSDMIYDVEAEVKRETYAPNLPYLKSLLRRLDLSDIRDEIKSRYGGDSKRIFSRWSSKNGIGADVAAMELNNLGIKIEGENEADLFFSINEEYEKAKESEKRAYSEYLGKILSDEDYIKLKRDLTESILRLYDKYGDESSLAKLTKEFKIKLSKANEEIGRLKAANKLIAKVEKLRNLSMGLFANKNTYKPDIFSGSIEQLKKIVRDGNINVKATRDALKRLHEWYRQDNPVVGDSYDADLAAKMQEIADKGIFEWSGMQIDVKDVLKPFHHKLNLEGIRSEIKKHYSEEEYKKIYRTWNVRKGEDVVSLKELSDELETVGLSVLQGDDYVIFDQIYQMAEYSAAPFTAEEYRGLADIVSYFTQFIEKFQKVWRKGRYVEAEPIAKSYIENMEKNKGIKAKLFHSFINSRFGQSFFRPATIARYMDKYEKGFYTESLESFREALINESAYELEMVRKIEEFEKSHKNYFEQVPKRKIKFRGEEIPLDVAMSAYMTAKRRQAQAGMVLSGFKYEDGKETKRFGAFSEDKSNTGIELGAERIQNLLYSEFSVEDKEFIKLAEEIFNENCKKLKYDTDMETKGYSNTLDGYYYPIKRAFVAKSVDSDFEDLMGRASNKAFNKDTVRGARGELAVMPLTEVLARHIKGIAQYAAFSTVIRNYDTLYNLDISENANSPTSIASVGETVWKKGNDYMKKLLADMQGVNQQNNVLLSTLRGTYATYQLGGNVKTWFTQLSSLFAATSEIDMRSVTKGMGVSGEDVDEYCTLAMLRNANNEAVLAKANANRGGILQKRTKAGDVAKKVSDVLMTPISKVDRLVVKRLFAACQVQIANDGGAKLGTVENKKAAGKLLERVIFNTQQNSLATERSGAMRGGEISKSLTMFSADAMNTLGQVIDGLAEISVLKARIRAATDKNEIAALEKRLTVAKKRAGKALFALSTSAAFMAVLAIIFNRLVFGRDYEDEEKSTLENITTEFLTVGVGNMLGGLPLIRDAYSYFTEGYEVENYMYSMLNDTLETVESIGTAVGGAIKGEGLDNRELGRLVKSLVYSTGQLAGIPTRNIYNVSRGVAKWFSPEFVYKLDDLFYSQSYNSDLKAAIEAEDEDMIATITGIMTGESVGDVKSAEVRSELNRLTLGGHSVLPRSVKSTVTRAGESFELSASQKKRFKKAYSVSNDAVEELMKQKLYKSASDTVRAKAIKFIYDVYYDLALDTVLGTDSTKKSVLFAEAIQLEKLALIIASVKEIEADKDAKGKTISGSRKKKIVAYVNSLNLTAAQKYMIMGYLGYRNANGKESVTSYINRLKLTKDEKTALLDFSGY